MDSLANTMGYNKETALKNTVFLEKGEYGEEVDFPLSNSKKIRDIGDTNAQEFAVLFRFEVCSVIFEKKLYFFNNNYQIVITLIGPKDTFVDNLSNYFTINADNCGEEKVWDLNSKKPEKFYEDLEEGKMPEIVQEWHSVFNRIVDTIEFFQGNENLSSFDALQGKWISKDDSSSMIEFKQGKKIDFYADEEIHEDNFGVYNSRDISQAGAEDKNGKYLIVGISEEKMEYEIIEATNDSLTLIYLDRGNTLKYEKINE